MKIDLLSSPKPIPYDRALMLMDERVQQIVNKEKRSAIWLLEHPSIYTAGRSAKDYELLNNTLPVYHTNRGGKYTYHGPGQRIAYLMLNIKELYNNVLDIKLFISQIQLWLVNTLKHFEINTALCDDNVGVWVECNKSNTEEIAKQKIASIGIRVKKGVTLHGVAINVSPDLKHFDGIIPCGIEKCEMTSVEKLHKGIEIQRFDTILLNEFIKLFNCQIDKREVWE